MKASTLLNRLIHLIDTYGDKDISFIALTSGETNGMDWDVNIDVSIDSVKVDLNGFSIEGKEIRS